MNEPGAKIWSAIRNHYAEGWLLFGLTWCPVFAWFTPTALPAMLFIWGIPFLVYFGRIKRFWPAAAMTAAMLVLGFLRSDFVTYLVEGKGFAAAWATKYWFAPIITWTVAWAVVLGFDALPERQAPRVAAWFGWLVIALACVQLIESISQVIGHTGALRTALNNAFYDGARPEMLIVGMANCNCILTMLFWPLCFFYVDRRQFA
ncbi:MAG: hypothetical protein JF615_14655, partial [Asticcacaulis sp.]|nr:hypothetical protein [Asticcacaulis sp.]